MKDKIGTITPKVLREAGFTESHFPSTAYRCCVKVNHDVEFSIGLSYNKNLCSYTLEINEYIQRGLEDRCRFSGLSTVSKVNEILSMFRYSDKLPRLRAENQSPDD